MTGRFKEKLLNSTGNYLVTFELENYSSKVQAENLKVGTEYKFEPKEVKSKRSLQQNKFLWKCLEIIAYHEQGERTDSDYVMELYTKMLEKSGAKYEYIMGLPEIKDELLKVFRAVKIVEYRDYNGKQMAVMKCFYGSSKMNTKEMNNLLDTIVDYAANLGLYIDEEDFYGRI